MSDASGDPLYRSDTRTAPNGAQQADLAPVSDQPEEHWEQQAQTREAEGQSPPPAPPGDPDPAPDGSPDNDAQTRPADRDGDAGGAPTASSSSTSGSDAQETSAPAPAPSRSESDATEKTAPSSGPGESHDGRLSVGADQDVTLGGEMSWSDASGDHTRSMEIGVDLNQATTLGGSVNGLLDGGPDFRGLNVEAPLAAVQQALAQTVALTQGLGDAIDSPNLQGALGAVEAATGAVTDSLMETSAVTAVEHLTPLVSTEAVSGALSDLGDLDSGAAGAPSAPAGLLASLFSASGAPDGVETIPDHAADVSGLDLGGLFEPSDTHPDLGLPDL